MRTLGGVILGLLLFFPGIELLRWLAVRVLGLYDAMTLTDGCLVVIIILMCVYLVRMPRLARPATKAKRSTASTYPYDEEPQLQYLSGPSSSRRQRRASRRRRDAG